MFVDEVNRSPCEIDNSFRVVVGNGNLLFDVDVSAVSVSIRSRVEFVGDVVTAVIHTSDVHSLAEMCRRVAFVGRLENCGHRDLMIPAPRSLNARKYVKNMPILQSRRGHSELNADSRPGAGWSRSITVRETHSSLRQVLERGSAIEAALRQRFVVHHPNGRVGPTEVIDVEDDKVGARCEACIGPHHITKGDRDESHHRLS